MRYTFIRDWIWTAMDSWTTTSLPIWSSSKRKEKWPIRWLKENILNRRWIQPNIEKKVGREATPRSRTLPSYGSQHDILCCSTSTKYISTYKRDKTDTVSCSVLLTLSRMSCSQDGRTVSDILHRTGLDLELEVTAEVVQPPADPPPPGWPPGWSDQSWRWPRWRWCWWCSGWSSSRQTPVL